MPARAARPLWRRLAYAAVTAATALVAASLAVTLLEQERLIDTFRQDDTVLYLDGRYLRLDADKRQYQIMDAQGGVVQASFPVRKRRGVFRVFVTGESFVRGGHHIPTGTTPVGYGTIADWMQELLEMRYPSVTFEVVNAGANGQNSGRVAAVVGELVNADPDLIIVAMGNNEGAPPVTAVSEELNDWILYRLVKKTVLPEPTRAERPAFQPQERSAAALGAQFQGNLDAIVTAAAKKGVRVALATLPLNLLEVGRSLSREELAQITAEPGCAEVESLSRQRRCTEALGSAGGAPSANPVGSPAVASCSRPFYVAMRAAQCMQATGDPESARELYKLAVEIEPRGRTRPSYNEAIRETARAHGLLLIDLEHGMEQRSTNGLPGDRYFIDRVHLTCMGYLPIARDLVDGIGAAGLIAGGAGEPLRSPTAAELLTEYPWDPLKGSYVPPAWLTARTLAVCSPDPALE